jgi:manganese/zinc/iron transport system substrate-binding protein
MLRLIFNLSLVFTLLFAGCAEKSENKKDDNLTIVTTTGMIRDAVENIVKEKAEVKSLMGPGVDPHYYKATQGDLTDLKSADIIFYNGILLEGKMEGVLKKLASKKRVFAVSEKIERSRLRTVADFGGDEKTYDPHIWFDVSLWSEAVNFIGTTMAEQDPDNADFYKKNTTDYLATLNVLHQSTTEAIHSIPQDQRILVTSHDAFGYFGDAYGIEVEALQGISTVAEFGLKDITDMVDLITARNVKAVFVESSVSDRSIQAVISGCQDQGHDVKIGGTLFSDAMGEDGSPEGTYVGMVKHNVKTIFSALQ